MKFNTNGMSDLQVAVLKQALADRAALCRCMSQREGLADFRRRDYALQTVVAQDLFNSVVNGQQKG